PCSAPPPYPHSLPTRRSSDLNSSSSAVASCNVVSFRNFSMTATGLPSIISIRSATSSSVTANSSYISSNFSCSSKKCLPCTYQRSEEHTSELQSRFDLVCRLL